MTNFLTMLEKNYTVKFLILFLATFAAVFAIWYTLMREESVNWLSSQIVHQISPYVIAETEDDLIVSNPLMGYDFSLPKGFKTNGAKNISFFMEEGGVKKCQIKHYYLNANKANNLEAQETRLIIPLLQKKLVFDLVNKSEINDCGKYLLEIKNNIVVD